MIPLPTRIGFPTADFPPLFRVFACPPRALVELPRLCLSCLPLTPSFVFPPPPIIGRSEELLLRSHFLPPLCSTLQMSPGRSRYSMIPPLPLHTRLSIVCSALSAAWRPLLSLFCPSLGDLSDLNRIPSLVHPLKSFLWYEYDPSPPLTPPQTVFLLPSPYCCKSSITRNSSPQLPQASFLPVLSSDEFFVPPSCIRWFFFPFPGF